MNKYIAAVRAVPGMEKIPQEQIDWLFDKGELLRFNPGDHLFRKGDPIDTMYVILSGKCALKFEQNGQFKEVAHIAKGAITGLLPYSRAKTAQGYGEALEDMEILALGKTHFPEMIQQHYELVEALVHLMTSRVREFTERQQLNDKLIALGKISAGLAHELNNPAAAVVRSSATLKEHLSMVPGEFKKVTSIVIDPDAVDQINDLLFERAANGVISDPGMMIRSDREDDLTDWLEDNDIENSSEVAETLVDFDFDLNDLEKIASLAGSENLNAVINWLNSVLTTEKLVSEIEDSAGRINMLVKSVKTYSHMDQAQDRQPLDLKKGINSTLTMLNHKIKEKEIEVLLDLPEDLPQIKAYAGEINQIWTNILDNAFHAVPEGGKVSIAGRQDREFLLVTITDNGPGIPEDIKAKIFDPFFTTKGFDEGTGLGLDIVLKIIRQHNGDIKVTSEPGKTEFQICLPFSTEVQNMELG